MGKAVKREEKKPYSKPTLTVYGTVRELTQRVGGRGNHDRRGGNPARNKTSFG
jgi:hypothetical protein